MPDTAAELAALQAKSLVSSQVVTPIKVRSFQYKRDTEKELAALQANYDEFVENSRMLEEELEHEIAQTSSSLSKVQVENEDLKSQLNGRNEQIGKIEDELASTSAKLTEERKLRISAELAQDEEENRARNFEAALESTNKECETLHEKLAYSESELDEYRMTMDIEREEHEMKIEDLENELANAIAKANLAESKLLESRKKQLLVENQEVRGKNHARSVATDAVVDSSALTIVSLEQDNSSVLEESTMGSVYTEHEAIPGVQSYDDSIQTPEDISRPDFIGKGKVEDRSKRVKRKRGFTSVVRKLGKKHFKGQIWFRSRGKTSSDRSEVVHVSE